MYTYTLARIVKNEAFVFVLNILLEFAVSSILLTIRIQYALVHPSATLAILFEIFLCIFLVFCIAIITIATRICFGSI